MPKETTTKRITRSHTHEAKGTPTPTLKQNKHQKRRNNTKSRATSTANACRQKESNRGSLKGTPGGEEIHPTQPLKQPQENKPPQHPTGSNTGRAASPTQKENMN